MACRCGTAKFNDFDGNRPSSAQSRCLRRATTVRRVDRGRDSLINVWEFLIGVWGRRIGRLAWPLLGRKERLLLSVERPMESRGSSQATNTNADAGSSLRRYSDSHHSKSEIDAQEDGGAGEACSEAGPAYALRARQQLKVLHHLSIEWSRGQSFTPSEPADSTGLAASTVPARRAAGSARSRGLRGGRCGDRGWPGRCAGERTKRSAMCTNLPCPYWLILVRQRGANMPGIIHPRPLTVTLRLATSRRSKVIDAHSAISNITHTKLQGQQYTHHITWWRAGTLRQH